MFRVCQHLQIFNAIVLWISIDMVNMFVSFQQPAQVQLHDMSMLSDVFTIDFDNHIFS